MMIVDMHMHVWRFPDHFQRETFLLNLPPHARKLPIETLKERWDNPVEDYLKEAEGIDKAVIIGMKFGKTMGCEIPNDYIAQVVRKHPEKFIGFCSVDPEEEGAIKELERSAKELKLSGLKLSPVYQNFTPNDRKYYPLYEKAAELNIPVAFHTGFARARNARLIHGDLLFLDDVAIDFPELKLIIAHMGCYHFEDAIHLAKKHENVFLDIGMLASEAALDRRVVPRSQPEVNLPYFHFYRPLLYALSLPLGYTDKILFASDWPASSPKRCIEILNGVNDFLEETKLPPISQKSIDKILYENWKKVLSLDGNL